MTGNISVIKSKENQLSWINIIHAQRQEIDYLRRKYSFQNEDLRDSYSSNYAQRPKFKLAGNYSFLILQFPYYNAKTRTITAEEVDFFIGKDFLVTIHNNDLPPILEAFNACAHDPFYLEQYTNGGSLTLLHEIILTLQEYCYPILDHIYLDIKNIENNMFANRERQMVREISNIKRNILDVKKIVEMHKDIIKKVTLVKNNFFPSAGMRNSYSELMEHTKTIWEIIENQKDLIESLEDTNQTLVSMQLNDVMKTLTIVSVIFTPAALLVNLFGMNMSDTPFANSPFGFWLISIIAIVSVLTFFIWFKRKKWL